MIKAELIAAMLAAPDDAAVYIDFNDEGILRSGITCELDDEYGIVLMVSEEAEAEDDVDMSATA